MSVDHFGGNLQNSITLEEHDGVNNAKRVAIVAGDIQIGAVEIKDGTTDTRATVGANGLYVDPRTGMAVPPYDYMTYTSGSTSDTYVFKLGGSGGTTVATIVISYTDSTKSVLSTVAKT